MLHLPKLFPPLVGASNRVLPLRAPRSRIWPVPLCAAPQVLYPSVVPACGKVRCVRAAFVQCVPIVRRRRRRRGVIGKAASAQRHLPGLVRCGNGRTIRKSPHAHLHHMYCQRFSSCYTHKICNLRDRTCCSTKSGASPLRGNHSVDETLLDLMRASSKEPGGILVEARVLSAS